LSQSILLRIAAGLSQPPLSQILISLSLLNVSTSKLVDGFGGCGRGKNEVPWALVCEEVMKLRVQLVAGKVLEWPGARVSSAGGAWGDPD
jgi:hypothetical protein